MGIAQLDDDLTVRRLSQVLASYGLFGTIAWISIGTENTTKFFFTRRDGTRKSCWVQGVRFRSAVAVADEAADKLLDEFTKP